MCKEKKQTNKNNRTNKVVFYEEWNKVFKNDLKNNLVNKDEIIIGCLGGGKQFSNNLQKIKYCKGGKFI